MDCYSNINNGENREIKDNFPKAQANISTSSSLSLTFGAGIIFLILAHSVYKMWIIQEPNTLELWNKLHFEEEKTESIYHV